jgi:hypothetical protein
MKLFFTIFAAILAAAAVIAAVVFYAALREKNAASDLRILESVAEGAKYRLERASIGGEIDTWSLDTALQGSESFRRILGSGRVDRSKAFDLTVQFVVNSRAFLKIVREKRPEKREWADLFESDLINLEKAASAL